MSSYLENLICNFARVGEGCHICYLVILLFILLIICHHNLSSYLENLVCNFARVGEGRTNLCKLKWLLSQRIALICSLIYLKLHLNYICEGAFVWLFSTVPFMFFFIYHFIISILSFYHQPTCICEENSIVSLEQGVQLAEITFIIIRNDHIYHIYHHR